MIFSVKMKCEECEWKLTLFTEDSDRAVAFQAQHQEDTGHRTVAVIDAVEETIQ